MLRFLSLVWQVSDEQASSTYRAIRSRLTGLDSGWRIAVDTPGLLGAYVLSKGDVDSMVTVGDNAGVIFGTLFKYNKLSLDETVTRVRSFTSDETQSILKTGGRSLCNTHWGSYVAFLRCDQERNFIAFRGPVGALPCFFVNVGGVTIYFSTLDDLLALRLLNVSINWDCILAQATAGDYVCRETALNEVTSVLSGEAIVHSGHQRSAHLYWSPRSDPDTSRSLDFSASVALLRAATRSSVGAWCSLHQRILLQLSGGFDSSVVMGCIGGLKSPPEVAAVNFYSPQSGDERKFARSVAERWTVDLVEELRDPEVDLDIFFHCARTATPVLHFSACDLEPKMIRMAHQRGATAILTGELGDNIFGRSLGPEVLAEYRQLYRLSTELLVVAFAYAYLNRVSVFRALRDGARHRRFYETSPYLSTYRYWKQRGIGRNVHMLTPEALDHYEAMGDRFVHPWLADKSALPPGKIQFMSGLQMVTSPWSQSPFGGDDAGLFVSPLASQLLVDAYMQIPTHHHVARGEDGAVAREAFRNDLPPLVLQRGRGKGTPELWIRGLVDKNRNYLREKLLEGALAKSGILDRRKLAEMLTGTVSKSQIFASAIFELLYIEAWLSHWRDIKIDASV